MSSTDAGHWHRPSVPATAWASSPCGRTPSSRPGTLEPRVPTNCLALYPAECKPTTPAWPRSVGTAGPVWTRRAESTRPSGAVAGLRCRATCRMTRLRDSDRCGRPPPGGPSGPGRSRTRRAGPRRGTVAVHLDRGVVDEHILPTVYRDEAVALVGVEPLHGALCHVHSYLGAFRLRTARSPGLRRRSRTCCVHALGGARARNLNFDRAGRYTIGSAGQSRQPSSGHFGGQIGGPGAVRRMAEAGVRGRDERRGQDREREHHERADDAAASPDRTLTSEPTSAP